MFSGLVSFPPNFALGTYTGHYEPVKEMSDLLDQYERETGHSVPIHGIPVVA
jgi:glutamate/tyrosine decarboxylase-like PLP-dependent enzyme